MGLELFQARMVSNAALIMCNVETGIQGCVSGTSINDPFIFFFSMTFWSRGHPVMFPHLQTDHWSKMKTMVTRKRAKFDIKTKGILNKH